MIRGILFDVDGTLFDSEEFIKEAYIKWFENRTSVKLTEEDFKHYVGMGEENTLRGVASSHGLSIDFSDAKKGIYDIYGEVIKGKLKVLPGVSEFISNAKKAGLKLALATSADRVKLDYSLKETGLDASVFDAIITGNMVVSAKPAGDIYNAAVTSLVLKPEECLVVEDAVSGHMSAKNAHCSSMGLLTSFGEKEQIEGGADLIIKDLSDFPKFSTLESFNKLYNDKVSEFRKSTVIGRLFDAAAEALKYAYAKYSNFRVGAAILTDKDNVYSGCNVENASYGATICAERNAATTAVAQEGPSVRFKMVVVASESFEPAPPCAMCRQFLSEFAGSDCQVYLVSVKSGIVRHYNFATVMPFTFEL